MNHGSSGFVRIDARRVDPPPCDATDVCMVTMMQIIPVGVWRQLRAPLDVHLRLLRSSSTPSVWCTVSATRRCLRAPVSCVRWSVRSVHRRLDHPRTTGRRLPLVSTELRRTQRPERQANLRLGEPRVGVLRSAPYSSRRPPQWLRLAWRCRSCRCTSNA